MIEIPEMNVAIVVISVLNFFDKIRYKAIIIGKSLINPAVPKINPAISGLFFSVDRSRQ